MLKHRFVLASASGNQALFEENGRLAPPFIKYASAGRAYPSIPTRTAPIVYYGKANYNLAVEYGKLNRTFEAEKVYRDMIATNFTDSGNRYIRSNAINNYATILLYSGKYSSAKSVAAGLLEQRQCDGALHMICGLANYYLGRLHEASGGMTRAIECFESEDDRAHMTRAYLYRGLINYRLQLISHAHEDFERTIALGTDLSGRPAALSLARRYREKMRAGSPVDEREIKQVLLMQGGKPIPLFD